MPNRFARKIAERIHSFDWACRCVGREWGMAMFAEVDSWLVLLETGETEFMLDEILCLRVCREGGHGEEDKSLFVGQQFQTD